VLSSMIEGTQSSLADLMLFELDEQPGVPMEDAREVSRYVAALEHGLERVRGGFPLSLRLIREVHQVLMGSEGRGAKLTPGEFRSSQVWIGGTRPGSAVFVPPPVNELDECLKLFERFLHDVPEPTSPLVKAALAHVQFETIHPFLDGNGRVGRLLITLLLCHAGVLREPLLYLSLYFKQHRPTYYELLDRVRHDGDWEAWLSFFLEGVKQVAEGAVATAERLGAMFRSDRARIEGAGRRAGSALRVHEVLKVRPIQSMSTARAAAVLSFPAASSAMDLLVELGIARELTGKRRNRLFVYDQYLNVLSEGTER